jgi:chaperonin GroES
MSKQLNPKSLNPAPGYLLIEPAKQQQKTDSGIYLPDSHDEKPQYGTILSVGDSIFDDGKEVKSPAKKGATVVYKKWGGNEVQIGDTEYQFLKFEDILAVVSK